MAQYTFGFQMGQCPDAMGIIVRLYATNPLFDQIYSQILTMTATGGIKGKVIYDIKNPGAGHWSDCEIRGLALYPK